MDGVLSDFSTMFKTIANNGNSKGNQFKNGAKNVPSSILWPIIKKNADTFWINMPLMPKAKQLWKELKALNVELIILTAPGSDPYCIPDKISAKNKN